MTKNDKKQKFNFKFSEDEYQTLRSEILERNSAIFSQSSTAIVTIISTWAAGISLLVLIADNSDIEPIYLIAICYFSSLMFLVPVFYFIPLSIKSGENLQQIASISAYLRVFYEYPSLERKKEIKNWEITNSLMSKVNVDRAKKSYPFYLYNAEYTILSSISFILYIISAYSSHQTICELEKKPFCTAGFQVLSAAVFIVLGILGLVSIIIIHNKSSNRNAIMHQISIYIIAYIQRGIDLGLFEGNVDSIYNSLNPAESLETKVDEYLKNHPADQPKKHRWSRNHH